LWHVHRTWLKQAYIKIKDGPTCATTLKSMGEILYNIDYPKDQEMDAWAKSKLERVANNLLAIEAFWLYVKFEWLPKTGMWVVGYCNLPYVGQDTNVAIKNYHANLKATLHSSKGRSHGRWVDWAIHALVGDVMLHYWYNAL
jgi:hypothetical protein